METIVKIKEEDHHSRLTRDFSKKKTMNFKFKDIHIGRLIFQLVKEQEIEEIRIVKFLNFSDDAIKEMYKAKSLDTEVLVRWSKLLKYDFFRIYSQHLVLYAPVASNKREVQKDGKFSELPQFRKNIYTTEIVAFILELIHKGEKSESQIISEYNIPKTTLYRWIKKHEHKNDT